MHSGDNVKLEQVEAVTAWLYKKYQGEQSNVKYVKHSNAELEARWRKIGLWSDPDPIPPWGYRQSKQDRLKNLEPFVAKSTVRGSQ